MGAALAVEHKDEKARYKRHRAKLFSIVNDIDRVK